jgi:16S rRNA (guanine527-N7)-methyltransferase
MATLTPEEIADLLSPYLEFATPSLLAQLSTYLDLLLKWNARTNLTAIRSPQEIVTRHFGESLFAAQHLGEPKTLLDFGSGAGFPGVPIALLRPEIHVTLAESQNKKASFLREAVRSLSLKAEIWPHRVEEMPPSTTFDTITLRAVDSMSPAIRAAAPLAAQSLILLTSAASHAEIPRLPEFHQNPPIPMPDSVERMILKLTRK